MVLNVFYYEYVKSTLALIDWLALHVFDLFLGFMFLLMFLLIY